MKYSLDLGRELQGKDIPLNLEAAIKGVQSRLYRLGRIIGGYSPRIEMRLRQDNIGLQVILAMEGSLFTGVVPQSSFEMVDDYSGIGVPVLGSLKATLESELLKREEVYRNLPLIYTSIEYDGNKVPTSSDTVFTSSIEQVLHRIESKLHKGDKRG